MKVKEINEFVVKPIPVKKLDKNDIVGGELFEEIYSNIFICAKKKSGKSTVIYNIIKKCTDKNTVGVIVFCSTYTKDGNWKAIKEYLDEKDYE